jgi:hypothetical protein
MLTQKNPIFSPGFEKREYLLSTLFIMLAYVENDFQQFGNSIQL